MSAAATFSENLFHYKELLQNVELISSTALSLVFYFIANIESSIIYSAAIYDKRQSGSRM